MEIILEKAGKRFNAEWIFRNLSHVFTEGTACAILGRNGSGKSTLLQVLAGNYLPTNGTVTYRHNDKPVPGDEIFRHLSLCAPYQELIEEFTLPEMIDFHFSFKQRKDRCSNTDIIDLLGFGKQLRKPLRQYSSGMRQRVKLALAILSDTPLLFLDEPTVNLDQTGTAWYLGLIRQHSAGRLILVCSNLEEQETGFCTERLRIEDYK